MRFENLREWLRDMRAKNWMIDSFPFRYKSKNYIVIQELYREYESKPNEYAVEFCEFFEIEKRSLNRDLFLDFAEYFKDFIPRQKKISKVGIEKYLLASRIDANNPKALYCYAIRRDGETRPGILKQRSIENSEKTELLRENLYRRYSADTNLSFCFSEDPAMEKTDKEIIENFAKKP